MFDIVLIAGGGAIGAVLRVLIATKLGGLFPYMGTFVVNIIGCLSIGACWAYAEHKGLPVEWRLFLVSGGLGAFTTFSTYGLDVFRLFQGGEPLRAVLYVLGTNFVGLGCVFLGVYVVNKLCGSM